MNSKFLAELWNIDIYAQVQPEINPYLQPEKFRNRAVGFSGDNRFWATPSPEPELSASWIAKLSNHVPDHRLVQASENLAKSLVNVYDPREMLFVAILRAGVPIADWLTRLLPGSRAVATSLFVGHGIDRVALQNIISDFPSKKLIFVDGWTGKGGVAGELRTLGLGPLAVLVDPWSLAEHRGTCQDLLSPSAFFTGPTTLGFSRTFVVAPTEMFAAYQFPRELLCPKMVEVWRTVVGNSVTAPRSNQEFAANVVRPAVSPQLTGKETQKAPLRNRSEIISQHYYPSLGLSHAISSARSMGEKQNAEVISERFLSLRLHSNEVARALINSNPVEILFRDNYQNAASDFDMIIEFSELQRIPCQYNVRELLPMNVRVACRLELA